MSQQNKPDSSASAKIIDGKACPCGSTRYREAHRLSATKSEKHDSVMLECVQCGAYALANSVK